MEARLVVDRVVFEGVAVILAPREATVAVVHAFHGLSVLDDHQVRHPLAAGGGGVVREDRTAAGFALVAEESHDAPTTGDAPGFHRLVYRKA